MYPLNLKVAGLGGASRARVFYPAGKRDLSNWLYLFRLVKRWGDIERILSGRGPGPWFQAVHENRVSEVNV
jgi:hypothetical protein